MPLSKPSFCLPLGTSLSACCSIRSTVTAMKFGVSSDAFDRQYLGARAGLTSDCLSLSSGWCSSQHLDVRCFGECSLLYCLLYQKDTREKYSTLTSMMIYHPTMTRLLTYSHNFELHWWCHHNTLAARRLSAPRNAPQVSNQRQGKDGTLATSACTAY